MASKIKAVSVRVNGKEIELNDFVEKLFGNTVVGMVSSLRLENSPRSIELCVEVQTGRTRKPKA